MLPSTLDS
jgi:hypothetical protein